MKATCRRLFLLPLLLVSHALGTKPALLAQNLAFQSSNAIGKYSSNRILVKFRPGALASARQATHTMLGTRSLRQFKTVPQLEVVELLPDGISVADTLRAYRQFPDVEYAEPDYVVHASATPNDLLFSQMWDLSNTGQNGGTPGADINAKLAWNSSTGGQSVIVAVIDSGIDYTHGDLAANMFRNTADCNHNGVDDDGNGYIDDCYGINPAYGTTDPMDDEGHGTHVAGTIGAVGNNGLGVTGVNWNVQIMVCKFLNQAGAGFTSDAITCLDYILAMKKRGLNIVATNNSWGGPDHSQALTDAIQAHQQAGILFIAAAGNDFNDNDIIPTYPANIFLPNVISVAATTNRDALANFSDVGRHTVHLGAPGQQILSTLPGNTYGVASGTSMATPHVTGAAALLAANNPSLDWRAIKNRILAGGAPKNSLAQTITGRRLDLSGAMTCSGQRVLVRLQPPSDAIAAAVGTPTTLAMQNINCAQPAGSVQVTVSPGGQVISLLDNGTGGDQAAGDGIYTAQWSPPAAGAYALAFPGNDVVTAAVLSSNYAFAATPFNYRAIAGTSLDLDDDGVGVVTSPFPVHFSDGSFSRLLVGSNGTISFTDAYSPFLNGVVPSETTPPVTLVAPFWSDLYPVKGTPQNVFWAVSGSAPNRELVVEWRNVRSFFCKSDPTATVSFEAVFSESTSNVEFQYADATFGGECISQDNGGQSTVGIQVAPNLGTMSSAGQAVIVDGTALLWATATSTLPPNPVPVLTSLSAPPVTVGGPAFTLTANGSNFVPFSEVEWNFRVLPTTYVSSTQLTAQVPAWEIAPGRGTSANVAVLNPAPGGGQSGPLTFSFSNTVPVITAISPSSATAGSFSFRLTVTGTGFASDSHVYWNGAPRTTVYYSPTEVVGLIFLNDLATAGDVQVTVVNPAPGGGTSKPATFTVSPSAGGRVFQAQFGLFNPAGLGQSLSPQPVGRFLGWKYAEQHGNEALKPFLRPRTQAALPAPNPVLQSALGSSVDSMLAAASPPPPAAGLQLRPLLPADFIPTDVAAGDFNGDGFVDWVVSNGGSNDLWIYQGNGAGSFNQATVITLAGQSPIAIATADLRGIGVLDLVVAEADSGTIGVLLGNGNGTFAPEQIYYAPGAPISLVVADFNGDGHLDVLAGLAESAPTGPLALLPGDGTGRLGAPVFQPGGFFDPQLAVSIAAGDFEKNGRLDVLLVDPSVGAFIYQNDGTGQFKRSQALLESFAGLFPVAGAQGDVNEDGCQDAVVSDSFGIARTFLGNCNGTLQLQSSQSGEGDIGWSLRLVDVNGDGHVDLVYGGINIGANPGFGQQSGSLIGVSLGDGKGNFKTSRVYRGGESSYGMAVADLNRDGHPDILAANQDSDSLTLLLNDGQGGFGTPKGDYIGYISPTSPEGVTNAPATPFVPADVDGDGKPDLVTIEWGHLYPEPFQLSVLLNSGTGGFLPVKRFPALEASFQIGDFTMADFRNTGHPDFLAVGSIFSGGNPFVIFAPNIGGGNFGAPHVTYASGTEGLIGVGDFNGDGKLDFATAQTALASGNTVMQLTTFIGHGDGTFTSVVPISFDVGVTNHWPIGVWVGDYNRDSKLDVLVWIYQNQVPFKNHDVYEFLGRGDGTFLAPKLVLSNLSPFVVVDVNHDGLPDIVESLDFSATYPLIPNPKFTIYLGQADGSFVLAHNYAPYTGIPTQPITYVGTQAGGRFTPWIGDFNGDGNIDIAAFQTLQTFPKQPYVQFMLGNGDGTFTPTYDVYDFGGSLPGVAADFSGDGKTDMVELDAYTSSFHLIRAQAGAPLQMRLVSDPVIGSQGKVRIALNMASAGTSVTLNASDPAITIPATATIPAGALTQDVPFQIGQSFVRSHVFWIQGTVGGATATAYGTQATVGQTFGFRISTFDTTETVAPSQTTADYKFVIESVAGYATSVDLSCEGLPAGASCLFGATALSVPQGGAAETSLVVKTSNTTPPGSYAFKVTATDGIVTRELTLTLNVGGFSISLMPASQTTLPNQTVNYTLDVATNFGSSPNLQATCSGLPAPATCEMTAPLVQTNPVTVRTGALPAGDYTLTISATDGTSTHTASAQLRVGDFNATLSATSLTVGVGQSGSVTLNVTGQNGFADPVQLICGTPSGAACSFNPAGVTPSAGGTPSTLTVTVNSRPSGQAQAAQAPLRERGPLVAFALLLFSPLALLIAPKKRKNILAGLPLTLAVLLLMPSCGGGASTGPVVGPGGGTSFNMTVQISSDGVQKTIGNVRVRVP